MPHEDQDDAGDLLHCPVCMDTFADPHLFPRCGHTFCRSCIERLSGAPHRMSCPTCRSVSSLPEIRPNVALRQILEAGVLTRRDSGTQRSLPALARGHTTEMVSSSTLAEWNVPYGLAQLLQSEAEAIARRIFLLDNSGSTASHDGKILRPHHPGSQILETLPCTRWEEVCDTSMEQARWNLVLGVPCEFHILNPRDERMEEGASYFVVAADRGPAEPQLAALQRFLSAQSPHGVTPLSARLASIRARIQAQRAELLQSGQRIILVIATDGLPTSPYGGRTSTGDRQEFVQVLRSLSLMDVHIVLRLCTDDDSVASFYGDVDKEVELSLEVLDDLTAEARELRGAGNAFLTYSPLIHRIRESGTFCKVFDVLDERALTQGEIYLLAQLLLRKSPSDPMLPREPKEFCAEVERRVKDRGELCFEPVWRVMAPPLDVDNLRWSMGTSGVGAALKSVENFFWGVCAPANRIPMAQIKGAAGGALAFVADVLL